MHLSRVQVEEVKETPIYCVEWNPKFGLEVRVGNTIFLIKEKSWSPFKAKNTY